MRTRRKPLKIPFDRAAVQPLVQRCGGWDGVLTIGPRVLCLVFGQHVLTIRCFKRNTLVGTDCRFFRLQDRVSEYVLWKPCCTAAHNDRSGSSTENVSISLKRISDRTRPIRG